MYDNWFFFFHSTKNEITMKNTSYKVTKEYMLNGDLKISCVHPEPWSIVLKPTVYKNSYEEKYEIDTIQKYIQKDLHDIVITNNISELDNIEKRYKDMLKMSISGNNNNKTIQKIQESIFAYKHDIYIKSNNIKEIIEIEKLLEEEKKRVQELHNYKKIVKDKSIIQKGKVPTPPSIQELRVKKYTNRKIISAFVKDTSTNNNNSNSSNSSTSNNNNSSSNNSNSSNSSDNNTVEKKGGFIKVIKLL